MVGQRDGNWIWNGSNWVCDPDCDFDSGFPPFGPPVFSGPTAQPPWYPGANGGVSFGATAPPNPVRGHMWWDGTTFFLFDGAAWVPVGGAGGGSGGGSGSGSGQVIISSTTPGNPMVGEEWWNGSQLRVWDGTQWNLVGPGATVGPVPTTTETFRIGVPTDLTIASSAWAIVPFTTSPQIDTQLAYDSISHKIMPTKPGVYLIEARGYGSTSGAGTFGAAVLKNDGGAVTGLTSDITIALFVDTVTATTGQFFTVGGITVMNGTTDFLRLFGYATTGIFHNVGSNPSLQLYLLP
jgi:hypothetical protein